ncbi:MAG: DUF6338 family protein [Jatrophihabitantaceae bacterium]
MPTTTVGLVVFVVLLAPGLTYSVYRAASTPVQKPSPLRELGGIALRSVIWDIAALLVFGMVRVLYPANTPDVGRLARDRSAYLRDHFAYVFWWAVALLLFACLAALGAALFASSSAGVQAFAKPPLSWFTPRGGVSGDPAWWVLFNQYPDARVYVGVTLDDGSYLGGWVLSYSPDSDESADRELTLSGPISYRSPTAANAGNLDVGAVAVSARRIQYLTVSYIQPDPNPPQPASGS